MEEENPMNLPKAFEGCLSRLVGVVDFLTVE